MYACSALVLGACLAAEEIRQQEVHRSKWVEDWLLERETRGSFALLHRELRLHSKLFKKYLNMSVPTFDFILSKIKHRIAKEDTVMRQAIPPAERLQATLLFLICGIPYSRLQYDTRIHENTLGLIIPEVCSAIYESLRDEFLKTPTTPDEWLKVAVEFERTWNFPNCIGAVDGKHVQIKPPPGSGSYYYNYKGFHSIVLLAIANANYEIIYANIGSNGRVSDGGVWANCDLQQRLESGTAGVPGLKNLPGSSVKAPHVLVADEAFPLKTYLMKPFPMRNQNDDQRIFSYRLSRARRIIENVFGIMSMRFRVLRTSINLEPSKVEKIILAIIALHNLLRRQSTEDYLPQGSVDQDNMTPGALDRGSSRSETSLVGLPRQGGTSSSEDSKKVRENFTAYFMNEGAVSWQREMSGLF